VLDVGCGIGLETARLNWHAGPTGRVLGVDLSRPMIAEARRRAAAEAWPIEYAVMDAQHLDLPEATFDLCRCERVLRYIEDPARAVREMVRVVRPGGHVVVFDFDSDATVIDASDLALTRRVRDILDTAVPHAWIGRQLPRLFRAAGLVDVQVVPHVLLLPSLESYRQLVGATLEQAVGDGGLSPAELDRWWADLRHGERGGDFLLANLGFIVSGRKPAS
jgi:ubiquinone/menaquinone biosynthesis C-methylase UbiE